MQRSMQALTLIATLLLVPASLRAADKKKEQRNPKELGRVVIVPFLDISGEKQESRDEYRKTSMEEVEERFQKHEIDFVPAADVEAAMSTLKMSPSDEEDRTKARFKQLADQLKVRWVVTGIIHGAGSGYSQRGFFADPGKAGQAKVQFRVFDAEQERYAEELESTATSTARAKGPYGGAFTRANKLRVKAVRDATKKAMDLFLEPYPKVHDSIPDKK